jgi:pullulanase-type alpha-1,6-glucosidase
LIGEAQEFTVAKDFDAIYFGYDAVKDTTLVSTSGAPAGNLTKLRAHWISADTLLWQAPATPGYTYALVYAEKAGLALTPQGISGGSEIPMKLLSAKPDVALLKAFPYLRDTAVFQLEATERATLLAALKGQVAVIARDSSGRVADATGVQIPGALDALFPYDGPLGVTVEAGTPTLRVWAPTAQDVTVLLYDESDNKFASKKPMTFDEASGVWSLAGEPAWLGKYYLYQVKVFVPATGLIETNLVTDPYSFSLSMNSLRSQIVDLNDSTLAPQGWTDLAKPPLAAPEDSVIYELHVRDFSISDESVPADLRGTFKAFTVKDSNGMKHLAALAEAGLTHIHLLPAFDIASVNEDKSTWQTVDTAALGAEPGDSEAQSAAVNAIKDSDGFNWGYDPLHYTVPEGSYSTNPDGSTRITEFREMVQALNQTGLRVVMDVVYNHTNASGQSPNSVLDRIVPGYYHRLNLDGNVEKSTCCENTATEHDMMRKLMVDSIVTWATAYKVDGFRFDLMGHHMLADMLAVRSALDGLTLEKDGVDGKAIYLYGEGWDFGEVANGARGENATQLNIGGSGIGVFNDRLRDAVRGGGPFDDPRLQGFASGLGFTNNANETRKAEDITLRLNEYIDWIKVGMAGNLASYKITRFDGKQVAGRLVSYNKAPTGYTEDPQENIIYVSAHDNETLFDAIQTKAPASASLAERIRMNNLALSTVMFSQGVPFFPAGDDLLRSKSLDHNSYNAGDWFNRLDWTYQTNNWAVGLPIEGTDKWPIYQPLLADPALKPGQQDILDASAVFRELLAIRKSSPLFRLQTADQIKRLLTFPNSGPQALPGLIVMRLVDSDNLDQAFSEVVVLFNAGPDAISFGDPALSGAYVLHPVQQQSVDAVVKQAAFAGGKFSVPGRTTAVFVIQRPQAQPTTAAATTVSTPAQPVPAVTAGENMPQSGGGSTAALLAAVAAIAAGLAGFFYFRSRRK